MGSFAVDIFPAFVVGLLSSAHCVGMCGPLATLGCRSTLTGGKWAPLGFTLGKLLSYSILGFLAAMIGAVVMDRAGIQRASAYVSIVGGILMLAALAFAHFSQGGKILGRISIEISKRALRWGKWMSPGLGFAAALLPCGVLYAMVARSAAAYSPLSGMLIMQAFGVGTMPALLGVGALMRMIPRKYARFGNVAAGVLMVITAFVLIWRGYQGLQVESGPPPCCGD